MKLTSKGNANQQKDSSIVPYPALHLSHDGINDGRLEAIRAISILRTAVEHIRLCLIKQSKHSMIPC